MEKEGQIFDHDRHTDKIKAVILLCRPSKIKNIYSLLFRLKKSTKICQKNCQKCMRIFVKHVSLEASFFDDPVKDNQNFIIYVKIYRTFESFHLHFLL